MFRTKIFLIVEFKIALGLSNVFNGPHDHKKINYKIMDRLKRQHASRFASYIKVRDKHYDLLTRMV